MTNDFKPAKADGNQPRLSKEEYAEKKRAEKEKVGMGNRLFGIHLGASALKPGRC